jgi:cobalt-zinc-cadmium efflux system membrane fusion protein
VPRVVTTAALDGATVAVTAGLQADERVVTHGATLLNQVR